MWLVYSIESLTFDFGFLGITPRTISGLIGIFTAPLIHGDVIHLASNTFPMVFLGSTIYIFYDKIASRIFMQCYFFPSFLVWIFGRSSTHIGASGMIYAMAFFLISFGLFRKDFRSILISIIIISLYGGLFYGVLPTESRVSWESHLMGAIVGVATASAYSRHRSVSSN
ncbi:MAG: rhomboid family intramembrane serine protease [Cyclobacteriaceae bacterium]